MPAYDHRRLRRRGMAARERPLVQAIVDRSDRDVGRSLASRCRYALPTAYSCSGTRQRTDFENEWQTPTALPGNQWTCPACRLPIRHTESDECPRAGVTYRCSTCHLELVWDAEGGTLGLAPLATAGRVKKS